MENCSKTKTALLLLFLVFGTTIPVHNASTIVSPPPETSSTRRLSDNHPSPKSFPFISFDSKYRRDERMETLYYGIRDMKVTELDKRVALALRMEPLIFLQALLSIYVLLNHVVEGLLPETIKRRIRVQNLVVVATIHISELTGRFSIPRELLSRSALFAQEHIVHNARKDMMHMIRGREGQQVAYALICLLCGMPVGCVLPIVIRDLPLLLKVGGIVSLLCSPNIREETTKGSRKKRKESNNDQWLEAFYVLDGDESNQKGEEKEGIMSSPLVDLMKKETRKQQQQQQSHDFDFRSSHNLRVMVDLVCESASLGMEFMLLSSFLWHQFTDFQGAKTGLPVVLKRVVCAALIVRYLQIRGLTLSELVVTTLEGSQTLETIRGFISSSSFPSMMMSWLISTKKNDDEEVEVDVEESSSQLMENNMVKTSTSVEKDHNDDDHVQTRSKADLIHQQPTGENATKKKGTKEQTNLKKKNKKPKSTPSSKKSTS